MRSFSWLMLLLAVIGGTNARGDEDARTSEARQHYEAGMAHYQLEEWDPAIAEFEAGFRLRPSSEFLFNIAQAYRLSNRPAKAVSFFQKYLRMNPDAPNRGEVERLIERAQADAANQEHQAAPPPPTPPVAAATVAAPSTAAPAASSSAMPAAAAPPSSQTTTTLTHSAPSRTPIYKKGWFWGVVGGVAVVAAGAVVVGVLLSTSSTTTLPLARF